MSSLRTLIAFAIAIPLTLGGCSKTARDLKLDAELARASLDQALKAWKDGKHPEELAPEIIIGDPSWNAGLTLVAFEVKPAGETSDGTNLYIPVACQLQDASGKLSKAETTYIVGTSPAITIFPQ